MCAADRQGVATILFVGTAPGAPPHRPHHMLSLLKLFRNYLFHQIGVDGEPVVDVGHMVHSLNKLDAGDPEQILLESPDNETVLVVRFSDVKSCLDHAFSEL